MSPDRNRLHMAIQKSGRLSERSRQLLRDAGLRLSESGKNQLAARAENFPLDLMFVRDDDIPTFVADGVCEIGIVGPGVGVLGNARTTEGGGRVGWRRSSTFPSR